MEIKTKIKIFSLERLFKPPSESFPRTSDEVLRRNLSALKYPFGERKF